MDDYQKGHMAIQAGGLKKANNNNNINARRKILIWVHWAQCIAFSIHLHAKCSVTPREVLKRRLPGGGAYNAPRTT